MRQGPLLDTLHSAHDTCFFVQGDHKLVIVLPQLLFAHHPSDFLHLTAGDRSFEDARALDNPYTLLYRGIDEPPGAAGLRINPRHTAHGPDPHRAESCRWADGGE
jgi:hypothetical protein